MIIDFPGNQPNEYPNVWGTYDYQPVKTITTTGTNFNPNLTEYYNNNIWEEMAKLLGIPSEKLGLPAKVKENPYFELFL